MRIVLQRAHQASVSVGGEVVGRLPAPGLVLLVGITHDDSLKTCERAAAKIWGLRILSGERSASDCNAPILAISQFTLYADVRKGRRPSWSKAAPADHSQPLFDHFVTSLRQLGAQVATGVFGAEMAVSLVNDGPMTILLDSAELGF